MVEQSQSKIDGIYAAYFTGAVGSSIGIFLFKEGIIAGADAGGGKYDGYFNQTEDDQHIEGIVQFMLPIGNQPITGAIAEAEPISIEVSLKLPTEINRNDVHRIETPLGPINAKFEKIRGF
jgi:hypothetical protein